ncbi:glycosyltransferase family 4 protein [Candidatus Pacearchaeota archaeon]|nr:glycosyltransferase family 4 protein [Candidatus Pacearchaeota archaeon]
MKSLVMYPYPVEADGQSLQGDLFYKGLLHHKKDATPCHFKDGMQKEFYLRHLKPDVAFGVGFWGNVPEVIREPLKFGVIPVPWFNADGWVANYKEEFEKLQLMFTTSAWVRSIYERDGVDVSKIIPMHIGIDTDIFKPHDNPDIKLALRRMCGVRDDEIMILTMGGDVTSKGAQEMFRALAQVDKEFKNWRYVCKAYPSECASNWRDMEEKLAEELGIVDKISFIDDEFSQEFMADLINACDIYAGPSRIEGFGMIQVEAMACGKPVISIDAGGCAETILHNKTGFLAKVAQEIRLNEEWAYPSMGYSTRQIIKFDKPKTFGYRADIDDLRDYTLKLLQDADLRKKMGEAGRIHTVENLDYRVTSKKMWDITREKLGLDE